MRLPFTLEDEEFFFRFFCIFEDRITIDICFLFTYKEEIEGAIYGESKYESTREDSEDRNRYIGEEFSEDSW